MQNGCDILQKAPSSATTEDNLRRGIVSIYVPTTPGCGPSNCHFLESEGNHHELVTCRLKSLRGQRGRKMSI